MRDVYRLYCVVNLIRLHQTLTSPDITTVAVTINLGMDICHGTVVFGKGVSLVIYLIEPCSISVDLSVLLTVTLLL